MRPLHSFNLCILTARASAPKWIPFPTRSYYSKHHPDPPPFPEVQEKILSSAMIHVPAHGFSSRAMIEGAKEQGYPEVSMQLFPRGVFDLVCYHLVTQRLALSHTVQFSPEAKLGTGQKIRTLVLERLRANADVIHRWQGVRAAIRHGQRLHVFTNTHV